MPDTFNVCPTPDSQGTTTLRTRVAQFGDGYSQAVPDGINNRVYAWALVWRGKSATMAPIAAFLDAHQGATSFYWTPPGLGSPQGLYRCASYTAQCQGNDAWQVSATFQQVFAP